MTLGQRLMDMQPEDDNGFQASAPGNRRIAGEIKWFDRRRGFGFVLPEDGSEDILIHCSTIEPLGRRDLPEGCAVTCEYRDGAKGRPCPNDAQRKRADIECMAAFAGQILASPYFISIFQY